MRPTNWIYFKKRKYETYRSWTFSGKKSIGALLLLFQFTNQDSPDPIKTRDIQCMSFGNHSETYSRNFISTQPPSIIIVNTVLLYTYIIVRLTFCLCLCTVWDTFLYSTSRKDRHAQDGQSRSSKNTICKARVILYLLYFKPFSILL